MRTGTFDIDGFTYTFDESGKMYTGIKEINGKKRFFASDGKMQKGFQTINGETYFFSRITGEMRYGFIYIDGYMYYFSDSGVMQKGNLEIDGIIYTFNSNGKLKSGWVTNSNNTYYVQSNGQFLTGWQYVEGQKCFFNDSGILIAKNAKKIIDVSKHQENIDWNSVKAYGDIDGVILRIGFGSLDTQEDEQLANNIAALKSLGIPYGIYLFSYAENYNEGISEANFTKRLINKYSINPTLGIYLDLESWPRMEYISDTISPAAYQEVASGYINTLNNYGYSNVYLYTGLSYSRNRLNETTRQWIRWIAQYNSICTYTGIYSMWQYTSDGFIPGISTRVDINVMF